MVNLSALNPFGYTVSASSEIVELRVYPIKSCRGISIKSTTLGPSGLDFDRRWMFVDTSKDNEFQTIRQISELTLIDTAFASASNPAANGSEDDLELVISIRGQPGKSVQVPARPTQEWLDKHTSLQEVNIWGQQVNGYLYGEEINGIFSKFLDKPLALVYKGPQPRLARANGDAKYLGREQPINYPDVMPLQVANTASLDELNSRLKEKGVDAITIERFRPNIILRGGEVDNMTAWSEDTWKTLRIVNGEQQSGFFASGPSSSIEMDVGMRCARCQVPNVDPVTAEKHKKEPWDTLVSYRRVDAGHKYKPCFGMLCAPRTSGTVKVGMTLEVIETTPDHMIKF